jgi:hypothetical protein
MIVRLGVPHLGKIRDRECLRTGCPRGGGWRKLHNEELQNLHTSPLIIRMTKLRRIKWVGHTAHIENIIDIYNVLLES